MTTWTVYKHLHADGTVLYVGCTKNLDQRNAQHRKYAGWWAQTAAIVAAAEFADQAEALAVERALISFWKPPHNRRGVVSWSLPAETIVRIIAEATVNDARLRERDGLPPRGVAAHDSSLRPMRRGRRAS